jgi:hypothetical protein
VTYVSTELRRLVAGRAGHVCEYCLVHEADMFFGCEVDHIVSQKHGGPTREDNLAYSCLSCNRNKGSDIASVHSETGMIARFFNPRVDCWADHFRLDDQDGVTILPLTSTGEVTARIFRFNDDQRLVERRELQLVDRYPTEQAKLRMTP